MASNIDINHLAAEIEKDLRAYSKEVVEKIDLSSAKVAKTAVKMLHATSPKRPGRGDYAHSWKVSTDKNTGQPNNRIVHAEAPYYRLTHLLENGHAKAGGGRVEAKPHIRDAEEWAIHEFEKEVREAIKNG